MPDATLTIISRNYGSWSLRGFLLCRMAGLGPGGARPLARRGRGARRAAAHVALLPRPQPRARGRDDLGHARDRRVPARAPPGRRPAARRRRPARALPLDLRRDARGLRQPAQRAADEPQGALPRLQGVDRRPGGHRPHPDDLARLPEHVRRPVPVRRPAVRRGRDVRAGVHALPDLRRAARRRAAPTTSTPCSPSTRSRSGPARPTPSPTRCRSWRWSSRRRRRASRARPRRRARRSGTHRRPGASPPRRATWPST